MAKLISEEKQYYKSANQMLPVKWCAPEVFDFGKFSSQSGL
jgi:hypothetical protein